MIACMTSWASLAVYHSDMPGSDMRTGVAVGFSARTVAAFLFIKNKDVGPYRIFDHLLFDRCLVAQANS
jgi:hypothetical protein